MRSALFWYITQLRVVILYRRFGTTYRSHLQGSRSTRNIPEQSRSTQTSSPHRLQLWLVKLPSTAQHSRHTSLITSSSAWTNLVTWRWRQYAPPKLWDKWPLHGVYTPKMSFFDQRNLKSEKALSGRCQQWRRRACSVEDSSCLALFRGTAGVRALNVKCTAGLSLFFQAFNKCN
jgi:hypothetical protein